MSTTSTAWSLDATRYRPDFPVLRRHVSSGAPLAYLDNAASTQRPNAVIDAIEDCYRNYYSNVHRGIHTLSEEATDRYERARQTTAEFLNSESLREIVFTPGTTVGTNTVAHSWGNQNVGEGDVILLPISEHHANIVPWHQLVARTGCHVEFLPLNDRYTIPTDVLIEHLDRLRPKMLAFSATSNVLGTEYPVAEWTRRAHEFGATVLVDAAQAAPHQVVDVREWDVDFLVFSGHKICGPSGIGVLYGKEELLDSMPPFLGGGGMIHRVTTSGFEPAELPEKFEAGTPPIAQAIGLDAAIGYVRGVGLETIHSYENELCRIADAGLRELDGVTVIGPEPDQKAGIVSFVVQGVHAHDVSQHLDTRGIAVRAGHHCTMPLHNALGITASTRASFYFYNTPEEVDRFLEAVREVRHRFAPSGRRRKRRH